MNYIQIHIGKMKVYPSLYRIFRKSIIILAKGIECLLSLESKTFSDNSSWSWFSKGPKFQFLSSKTIPFLFFMIESMWSMTILTIWRRWYTCRVQEGSKKRWKWKSHKFIEATSSGCGVVRLSTKLCFS